MATPKTETLSACVDSYGSAVGMPQLCGEWKSNQIFWLVISLLKGCRPGWHLHGDPQGHAP